MSAYDVRITYWTGPKGARKQERLCVEVDARNIPEACQMARARLPADAKVVGKPECRYLWGAKISAKDPRYQSVTA